ncbi:MAG: hypothetical protein O3A95_08160 [Planctomycetota bacterium]|nr:hypothetical protein [Planctomycetota bacterium]MDA1114256.1 hypothetical protein [Planctomycetota bacterium]
MGKEGTAGIERITVLVDLNVAAGAATGNQRKKCAGEKKAKGLPHGISGFRQTDCRAFRLGSVAFYGKSRANI